MKVKFCGAAQEVTGSSHLLELESGFKILLDCGLTQGNKTRMKEMNYTWQYDPAEIDLLILSHAHIDHSGKIPKLVRDGFKGQIHCTHATRSLCAIMLLDSAMIQERDAEYFNKKNKSKIEEGIKEMREPLYVREDVSKAMDLFVSHTYNKFFNIHPDVKLNFRDNGHILGSASVRLKIQEGDKEIKFGFSGDVGRPNRPILRDPVPLTDLDYLICESTYGGEEHESKPNEKKRLLEIIKRTCVENKGKLIIPAFSVGRTQEIVYMMDQMSTDGVLPKIPVYVDSPLAVNATVIFGSHPECYDNDLHEYLLIDENPFGFNNLHYTKAVAESKLLNEMEDPCVIISAAGMMNAGRIRHHMFNHIDRPENTFLIVGYCTPDTPCGMLKDGIKEIKLFGEWKPIKATIEIMDSFSAHGDQYELLEFIKSNKESAKQVFLVHGELPRQLAFKELLNDYGFENVLIPTLGEEYICD